jgi:hypothetical protein
MQRWQAWLNSLATVGGNLFLLTFFVLVFLSLVLFVLHDANANAQIVTTVASAFTSFSGALLLGLKGRTSDPNPSMNGGASTSTSSTQSSTSSTGSGIPGEGHP